jgi:hypothetical protein
VFRSSDLTEGTFLRKVLGLSLSDEPAVANVACEV